MREAVASACAQDADLDKLRIEFSSCQCELGWGAATIAPFAE